MTARPSRRLRSLAALTGILLLATAPAATRDIRVDCEAWVWFENDQRKIFPTPYIDAECETPIPWHTVPFGNWGVDSDFGSREDAEQFRGWYNGEWNSCTQDYSPSQTPWNWNEWDGNGVRQASYGAEWHATWYLGIFEGTSCADVGGIGQYDDNFMSMRELDPWDDDEFVDRLHFPPLSVDATGCDEWGCAVAGEYEAPFWAQNGSVYAEARMKLFLQRIETEVCEESCPLMFPLRPPARMKSGVPPLPDFGIGLTPMARKLAMSRGVVPPSSPLLNRSIRHRPARDGIVAGEFYEVPVGNGGYVKVRRTPTKR